MDVIISKYTKERIKDILDFEKRLREEENFWGWEIDEVYIKNVENSFDNEEFQNAISFLAYVDEKVVGRIDASIIVSHFDGSKKAYLDWICVIKSYRHNGVSQKLLSKLLDELKGRGFDTLIALTASNEEAQSFYRSIPNSEMKDTGIWIDIK